ncbi:MAG: aminotransferase class I/II-fold pyridoxal phosphate-dependent enzyme [Alphaproteobacteria bacterium]
MANSLLNELTDYPFIRLRKLLDNIEPCKKYTPLVMSIGEPQMQPPAILQEALSRYSDIWNKYPPMAGSEELRYGIGEFLEFRYGLTGLNFDALKQIIPVNGSREGLFMAAMLCIDKAKSNKPVVLMPNPFYQVYHGASVMNGAKTYFCAATSDNNFQPDFSELACDILEQTQLAYICSPSNPQGALMGLEQMKNQLELARKYNFTLVVDECYSEIYRDGFKPAGGLDAAKALGGSLDNLLIINSLSKRSSAAGLRSGFVAGDKKLIAQLLQLRNYGGAVLAGPIQGASTALWQDQAHVAQMRKAYNEKFAIAADILRDWPNFQLPQGGFFLWLPVGDDEKAARILWQDYGLRILPGSYLSRDIDGINPGKKYIRVALVHNNEQIHEGLTRLGYAMDAII